MYHINILNTTNIGVIAVFKAHIVDPVQVRADLSKDSWLLVVVAAQPRAKANNTMNLPGSIRAHTVQRATRVSLNSPIKTNSQKSTI